MCVSEYVQGVTEMYFSHFIIYYYTLKMPPTTRC